MAELEDRLSCPNLLVSVYDSALRQVVRREFNPNAVSREYLYEVHPHFPRKQPQNFMTIPETDAELRVR